MSTVTSIRVLYEYLYQVLKYLSVDITTSNIQHVKRIHSLSDAHLKLMRFDYRLTMNLSSRHPCIVIYFILAVSLGQHSTPI